MNNREEFNRQLETSDLCFRECINIESLFREFKNTKLKPNFHLFLSNEPDLSGLSYGERQRKFSLLKLKNQLDNLYFSHFITDTDTYKSLKRIHDIYARYEANYTASSSDAKEKVKRIIAELKRLNKSTAVCIANELAEKKENITLSADIITDSLLGNNFSGHNQDDWLNSKDIFDNRLISWVGNLNNGSHSHLDKKNEYVGFGANPYPQQSETLTNLITHDKAPEIVKQIKIHHRGIGGRSLKFLLLALKELKIFPSRRKDIAFHRCCEREFDWDDVGTYEGLRKVKNEGTKFDARELNKYINFLNNIIKDG